MRLYLSSFRMGERFDDLLQLTGGRPRVALVANALDFIDAGSRRRYAQTVYSPVEEFRSAGADVLEVDLRRYFGRADALADDLADADLLWLTGGNTFLLRRAMVASGLDAIVRRRLSEDSIAYGGESAGAVAACKSLEGIHLMDDPGVQADGDPDLDISEGLGLIDVTLVPHYRSQHAESEAAEAVATYLTQRNMPFRTLSDGEVLIVNN